MVCGYAPLRVYVVCGCTPLRGSAVRLPSGALRLDYPQGSCDEDAQGVVIYSVDSMIALRQMRVCGYTLSVLCGYLRYITLFVLFEAVLFLLFEAIHSLSYVVF